MTEPSRVHQPYDPLQTMLLFQPKRQGNGLRGLINGLLPHAYVDADSPVFTYELRDWTRGRTPYQLKETILWALLRDGLFAVLIWALALAISSGEPTARYDSMWRLCTVALVMSALAGYILDGFSVFVTAFNNRAQQMDGVHYDLLSLSHIDTEHLVRARFAAAQIRIWNLMRTVISIRLFAIIFVILNLLAAPSVLNIDSGTYLAMTISASIGFLPGPVAQLMLVTTGLMFGTMMLLEPLWRLRALSAAGMAAAGNRRPTTVVLLYGAAALVGVWLIQTTLLVVTGVLTFAFSLSPTCLMIAFPTATLIGGGNLRMLYFGLQFAWLRTVYNMIQLADV